MRQTQTIRTRSLSEATPCATIDDGRTRPHSTSAIRESTSTRSAVASEQQSWREPCHAAPGAPHEAKTAKPRASRLHAPQTTYPEHPPSSKTPEPDAYSEDAAPHAASASAASCTHTSARNRPATTHSACARSLETQRIAVEPTPAPDRATD